MTLFKVDLSPRREFLGIDVSSEGRTIVSTIVLLLKIPSESLLILYTTPDALVIGASISRRRLEVTEPVTLVPD